MTPWERHEGHWVKRDDLFEVAGVRGGKARTCFSLARAAQDAGALGLATAGSRQSPQVNIVAQIGAELGMGVIAFVPSGPPGPELESAAAAGAELRRVTPGYNGVISARAREFAAEMSPEWSLIPFGMECAAAVEATRAEARESMPSLERLVVPVGSGMSLCGILWGMLDAGNRTPVLGVCVGANPERRLDRWAPPMWRALVELRDAAWPYHVGIEGARIGGVLIDPHYEAKCLPELREGDGLWLVGVRGTHGREEVAT